MKVSCFTRTLFLAFFILGVNFLSAQVELTVNDPQWWGEYPGSIDEASLVVKPKGIYMEVSMYLTFSAQGAPFAPDDTLEVVLDFNLSEDAIVHDSWLWIEDQIIKAEIIDRWTASEIYEEIVGRQQDPSILFKESADKYKLRIYPMAANSSRRVKISYLAPTKWRGDEVLIDLPYEILTASQTPLDHVEIITYLDPEWTEPHIKELDTPFLNGNDPELGPYQYLYASTASIQTGLTFSVKSPMEDGLYANQYAPANMYQLAFSPAEIFDITDSEGTNIAFVLSHHPVNSNNVSKENLLFQLRETMLETLSEGDHFNLFLDDSGSGISEEWIYFNIENVNMIFGELFEQGFPDNNNLSTQLISAVDFIVAGGGQGEIIAISNSDEEGEISTANNLVDQLLTQMGAFTVPVHIIDYQNTSFEYYYWDWNDFWVGNEYFYNNLARLTGGNYDRTGSISEKLQTAIQQAKALYGTLDLYTTLEEGFCYQRYNLGPDNDLIDLSQPILQVGKYQGNFPLKIIANGFFEGNVFSTELVLPTAQIHPADTLAEEIWAGRYVHALESSAQSNQNIAELIERSINERVLSLYTAFLCLEPGLGGEPCVGCIDETGEDIELVGDHEIRDDPFSITAYPNPFVKNVQLRLEFAAGQQLENYQFNIYNAYGQLVKRFNMDNFETANGLLELDWNAEAECIPSGVYFFTIENGTSRQTVKLIKI